MKTQQQGHRYYPLLCSALLFIALLLTLAGCGSGSVSQAQASNTGAAPGPTRQTPVSSPTAASTPTAIPTTKPTTPTPQLTVAPPVLQGPTNFLLRAPFTFSSTNGVTTDDNGTTIPLSATTIQTQVAQELQHQLFVVDSSDNIKVYSRGESPVAVQFSFNSDGTAAIGYTQTVDSEAGTVSIIFTGTLSRKQIAVNYEQQYNPSMLINAQASDVVVSFTAPIKWATPEEIPAAPSNGTYQMTSQGGVALAWSAGQNASAYNVYRLISDQNQQFQLLSTVKGTSYTDNSTMTIQNMHATKGVTYAIFSVGPTGIENPGGIVISL